MQKRFCGGVCRLLSLNLTTKFLLMGPRACAWTILQRWCSWIQSRPPQPRNGRQRPRSTLWETSMRRRCGAMQRLSALFVEEATAAVAAAAVKASQTRVQQVEVPKVATSLACLSACSSTSLPALFSWATLQPPCSTPQLRQPLTPMHPSPTTGPPWHLMLWGGTQELQSGSCWSLRVCRQELCSAARSRMLPQMLQAKLQLSCCLSSITTKHRQAAVA
mmetsp:Transcript_27297/g.70319  ORF Transcript_27297/g.70319 Transcript_27297/m.70319 type:complete len:219 (-) Transcript_27297:152-808(-)